MKRVRLKPAGASDSVNAPADGAGRSLLTGLNSDQRKAVEHQSGPLLILAGAGSGKTRALTFRIAHLITRGVKPWNILALTFTNKAAAEMRERIARLVGDDAASKIWAGTFHSIFARILRREADKLGYTSSFSIHDSEDSLNLIKLIMGNLGISQQEHPPQAVRSAISSAKNSMTPWEEYSRNADSIFEKQTGLVYKEYEQNLKRSNAMDFDDLLINIIRLFEAFPAVLDSYRERFQHVLVDEYQDTNKPQYRAVQLLAWKHRNLCVVGDDAQSIYRWRGADIENILTFESDFKDATVVRLERNYRSTKRILAAANDVIVNNRRQLKKELWTENDDGDPIYQRRCRDEREEASSVVDVIRENKREHGLKFSDCAVLYRINAQSQVLEDALRAANIPYRIVGGISFYRRKEVKDVLAYLKLLVNPSDSESLLRIINEPARGIGKTTLGRLTRFAQDQNLSVFEACNNVEHVPHLQKRARTAIQEFAQFIRRFIEQVDSMPAHELARAYIDESKLLSFYAEAGGEENLDRWNNVQRVISHIAEFMEVRPDAGLAEYLQEVALVDDTEQMVDADDVVTLMTMHGAKGLEFPVVCVVGMEKGLFPLSRAEQQPDELEEERRLFYVAITRAEQRVYLSHCERRYRFGELSYPMPSGFLDEIRPELVEKLGVGRQRDLGALSGNFRAPRPGGDMPRRKPKEETLFNDIPANEDESYSQLPPEESRGAKIRPGMRVGHSSFGEGQVLRVAGSGDGQRAIVRFKSVGEKTLLLKYAKLQVLG